MATTAQNTSGKVFYGLHFYPGLAEYREPGKEPYRVFLNEDTIRAMDPTFQGKPVYVHHVDGVPLSVDEMRKEMDGVVVESFFNDADGKHWVKFVVFSERGFRAIQQGMRLSNCYEPRAKKQGGMWNGMDYQAEITAAEYEHLALVPNPRYEESVVITPEEFKKYNDDKRQELKRLANNGDKLMVLKLFRRAKVENAVDLAEMYVALKSGRELTITQLVNEADEKEEKDKAQIADGSHYVKVGNDTMTVNDLVSKHNEMCQALDDLKKAAEKTEEGDEETKRKNAAEAAARAEAARVANAKKAEDARVAAEKAAEDARLAKEAADRIANEKSKAEGGGQGSIELTYDKVARGKALFG